MDAVGLQAGVDLFRQAIDKDKAFAQPYSYLAFALLHQAYLGFSDDPESTMAEATALGRPRSTSPWAVGNGFADSLRRRCCPSALPERV